MCLIIFAYQENPQFPLVVAANRDELFARPTAQADFWLDKESGQQILAGRDLQAGGTWLGVTTSGRFAAVTNIRDPSQTERKPRSRGDLTRKFLAGSESPQAYCEALANSYDQFAGYNLLVGDSHSLFYVNNQEEKIWELEAGIYGLSNGLLNSSWPKVHKGRDKLKSLMQLPLELNTDALISIMDDRTLANDSELPDTGISIEIERKLSSAFIMSPEKEYGTLCSTAVIMEKSGELRFSEQNFDLSGNKTEGHSYHYSPPS